MTQHTLEPWGTMPTSGAFEAHIYAGSIGADNERGIAEVYEAADARVIVKVPEMLELIRDFERNIVEDMNSIADHANNRDYMAARSLALQVQQIVAKRTRALLREIEEA